MAQFEDLRLNRPDDPQSAPEPDRRAARLTAAALIVLLLGGAAAYFTLLRKPADTSPPRAQSRAPARPLPAEPPTAITVPPLDESDALVRQLVSELSTHPKVAAWLATDRLIRNFAVVILNIADHQSPAKHLTAVRPAGAFATVVNRGGTFIDPASHRRYDAYAD